MNHHEIYKGIGHELRITWKNDEGKQEQMSWLITGQV
jgi:hypothetical protein